MYFSRYTQFTVVPKGASSGITINNNVLTIHYTIPFDDDFVPNVATITAYNLSNDTKARIRKGDMLSLNSGYKDNVGQLLYGEIVSVWHDKVGTDKATIISVVDRAGRNNKQEHEKSYKEGVKSSTVIKDIAKAINLKIKLMELPKDVTHVKGFKSSGNGADTIKRLAEDCGASFYVVRGEVFIRDIKKGDTTEITLSVEAGLVDTPSVQSKTYYGKTVDVWSFESLLQHGITTASIVNLKSATRSGRFRVIKGRHVSNANEHKTYMEALVI